MSLRQNRLSSHLNLAAGLLVALTLAATAGCGMSGAAGERVDFKPTLPPLKASGAPAGAKLVAPSLAVLEKPPERPLYVLNVSLDYENGVLNTQERIEFKNPSGAPLSEIKFNVPAARRAGAIDISDARIFGDAKALTTTLTATTLSVKLPAPLPPNSGIAMQFNYTLRVPLQDNVVGIGGDDTSRGPFSLTAGHWFILLAPYKDANWYTPGFVPIGDTYSSDVADYEVNILAPENVGIAGAGDEKREGRLWKYSLPKARTFAFAASDRFKVDKSNVDGVEFVHYAYPQHQKFAEDVLITAERAVKLYSQLWGPYPYKTFRIVETGRAQGQEYSGLVGIGSRLYDGYKGAGSRHDIIATTAHETAHQWWFHVVGNDQIRTPWLDESLARFAELRYYETYYPSDVKWWDAAYIGNAKPAPTPTPGRTSPVASAVGAPVPSLKGAIDLPITAYADTREYIVAVYQRGLQFLSDLRDLVGSDAFDQTLKDFYQDQSYKIATPDSFFDALARHAKQDVSPLVRGYFAGDVKLPCAISNAAIGCRR